MRLSAMGAILWASASFAQPAGPAFEVASIKVSTEGPGHSGGHTAPGSIRFQNRTLTDCIMAAYNVRSFQVTGGPKWMESDRYNIDAKAAGPAGDADLMLMVRTLLADRFQLVFHRETRQAQGYAMVLGKGGLKIKPSETEGNSQTHTTRNSVSALRISMEQLASTVGERLGVPVVDATGVPGVFDIELKWTPDEELRRASEPNGRPAEPQRADAPPSLPDVLQNVSGLKLEARKVPIEVLVIDRAGKPAEN